MASQGFKSKTIRSGGNAKTVKGDKGGEYETAIMYLAPYTASGMGNVCANAGPKAADCASGCLFHEGRARVHSSINIARANKTKRYFADRAAFMAELVRDISAFVRYCDKRGVKPAVRLNGTSDIQWEVAHPVFVAGQRFASIFEAFPQVQFYDYTKVYKRAYRELPANYALTLSYSEANPAYATAIIKTASDTGANVAIVFRTKAMRDSLLGKSLPQFWGTLPVIDGDETDMRFLDPAGVIVGLYAKGQSRHDRTGFIVG